MLGVSSLSRFALSASPLAMAASSPAVLLEGFDALAGFVASSSTQSLDVVGKVQGVGALKLAGNGTAGSNPLSTKTTDTTRHDPATFGTMAMFVRIAPESERQVNAIYPQLGRGGSYIDAVAARPSIGVGRPAGGYWMATHISERPTLLALGPGQFDRRVNIMQQTAAGYATYANIASFDALVVNVGSRATFVPTFDDMRKSTVTKALPYMRARGMVGTLYYDPGRLGADSDHLTVADVQALFDAGWAICCNGTTGDTPMTAAPSLAAAIADLKSIRQDIINRGWARGGSENHFCYPTGYKWGDASGALPASVVLGNVSAAGGNGNVTFPSAVSADVVGSNIYGYQVPAGTTILSVASDGLTGTTSANLPAIPPRPMIAIDQRGEFYMGKLQAAAAAEGFISGRDASPGIQNTMFTHYGFGDQVMILGAKFMPGNTTAASMKVFSDEAFLRGTTLITGTHGLTATDPGGGSIDVLDTVFYAIIDDWAARVAAGAVVLTIPQLIARDGNGTNRLPV